ncbi:hypothetical protein [Actinobacillus equuli]|uniref:hypothetical protein n=1 Tax=Actinobacillus equuli TaxID=718 RepID=UPI0024428F81|nr:hypothetical protein [Actinobacillus equuli]WGE42129.1 hypothetical protein NYR64_10490 [Actinobacillus equuli subsp. haemolyticus]
MTKIEQIREQQRQLQIQFKAWMDDKKKREVLTFQRPNGNIVRHYPDGHEEVIDSDHIAMQISPENPRAVDSQIDKNL